MADNAQANNAMSHEDAGRVTDYLRQANAAAEAGNPVLAMHLYLSAFGLADADDLVVSEDAISSLKRAWSVACKLKERSMAEYIFEKMEPFLSADELNHCTKQLQDLALDKLAEFGLPREALQGVSDMLSQSDFGAMGLNMMGGFPLGGGARIMHVEKLPGIIPGAQATGTFTMDHPASSFQEALGEEFDKDAFDALEDGQVLELGSEAVDGLVAVDAGEDASGAAAPTGVAVDAVAAGEDAPVEAAAGAVASDAAAIDEDATDAATADASAPVAYADHAGASDAPGQPSLAAALQQAAEVVKSQSQAGQSANLTGEDLKNALKQTAANLVPQAPSATLGQMAERLDYTSVAGYAQTIDNMAALGIGVANDPDFQALVQVLNKSHGLDRMPAADTLLFRAPSREDASRFIQATLGELGLPVLRMSMEENAQGMPVLCVMANANAQPKMNAARNDFESPAVLVIDNLDLWVAPQTEQPGEGLEGLVMSQLGRGAREAVALIRNAVENPDVYVMASLSTFDQVDSFFCDLLTPFALIEIDNPNDDERYDVWASLVGDHPSLAYLDADEVVRFSANLSRNDMYLATREAIEEAYKQSLASREYAPVSPENMFEKLSAYQPLESQEYKLLEDSVVGLLRSQLEGTVDDFLGLSEQ